MNNTKRRIFETAIKLFAQKGYENTGIDEITAVAGYAKGALYYHFETKEDLFDLLVEEGFNLLSNSIEIKMKKCDNPVDKIKAILMVEVKSIVKYEELITVIMNNILGDTSRTKKCKAYLAKYIDIIKDVVQEGIDKSMFYEGDSEAIACGIWGVTFSSLLYRVKNERNVTIDQIYDSFAYRIIRGISK